jgi:hypothetical protein
MQPLSRRQALLLGGLGVAGTVVGGAGLFCSVAPGPDPVTGAALTQPPVWRSADGQLRVRLEAGPGPKQVAGRL